MANLTGLVNLVVNSLELIDDNTGQQNEVRDLIANNVVVGPKGDTGAQGLQGVKGDRGETLVQTMSGPVGDKGDKGDSGQNGAVGSKGPRGAQGIQGNAGPAGAADRAGPHAGCGEPHLQLRLLAWCVPRAVPVQLDLPRSNGDVLPPPVDCLD